MAIIDKAKDIWSKHKGKILTGAALAAAGAAGAAGYHYRNEIGSAVDSTIANARDAINRTGLVHLGSSDKHADNNINKPSGQDPLPTKFKQVQAKADNAFKELDQIS